MQRAHSGHRGFTVIELMISVAIIFLLVTVAMVALRAARRGADRTQTLGALRQMIIGYSSYYNDHNGQLLPGYVAPTMIGNNPNQLRLKAELESGFLLNNGDTGPYVWRLAPYVDHDWKVFMADYESQSIIAQLSEEYGAGNGSGVFGPGTATGTQIGIAKHPSFGLNSLFVGGDSFHGGSQFAQHPWATLPTANPNTYAITKLGQAKNPASLIVFAPSQAADQPTGLNTSEILGYAELRAPFRGIAPNGTGAIRQWYVEGTAGPNQNKIVVDPANFVGPGGLPVDRRGENKLATAHLDGSVTSEEIEAIGPSQPQNPSMTNFSRWIPSVISPN